MARVRWGLDGKLLDLGKQKEVPTRDLIRELLDFVDDVVDDLDSRREIEHIHTILERGTSADEQLQVYEANNQDFKPVVDMLIKNTLENVPELCRYRNSFPARFHLYHNKNYSPVFCPVKSR